MKTQLWQRRRFLRKMMWSVPLAFTFPQLISSCKKDKEVIFSGKVIIIGAGASGLYAAHLLNEQGIEVDILEASSSYGGRIRPLNGFSDFPIELGAEEVHGQHTAFYDILTSHNTSFVTAEAVDNYWLDNQIKPESQIENDPDVQAAYSVLDSLEDYYGSDITVATYLQQQNLANRVLPLMEAAMGNEYGTSNTRLSMLGLAESERNWEAGNDNFLLKNDSILSVLEQEFQAVLSKIHFEAVVNTIEQNASGVKIITDDGEEYSADKVIITVPLNILKGGSIHFSPALPADKTQAINAIGMDAGMKILLKFHNRFWPVNLGSLIGGDLVPEYWSTGFGRSQENNVLTAFVMGEKAEYLSSQGGNAVNLAVQELDSIYGSNLASSNLADSYLMDWSQEPFIQGAYSYPKVGTGNSREALAVPVNDKLYFAGEAANTAGHFGTVHGAMEAGKKAVEKILYGE